VVLHFFLGEIEMKLFAAIWNLLYQNLGVKIVTKAVFDMTVTPMRKIEEFAFEYFGPMAYAGGRPILTPDYLSTHRVGVPGTKDVIWNPLYDFAAYPSAGQLLFTFYANQIGQGTSSAPGAGAVAKSLFDTNLQINNQLTQGNEFYGIGSESLFYPGVSNAALPLTVLPGRSNVPTTVGIFANDVWSVGNGGLKVLTIGTDRRYIQDGPLFMFPPATRLAIQAAVAEVSATATGVGMEITYAAWSGEPYTIVPIYIESNQSFTMQVTFAALIPTPSTQIGRLGDRLRGYLVRQAT
jgi:hypothetical protein